MLQYKIFDSNQQPPEDGCMKPKHVVEEEEENK
jgi:hypothetical protein